MIRVAGFDILIPLNQVYFYLVSKRLSQSHVLQYWICFLLGCPRLKNRVTGLAD